MTENKRDLERLALEKEHGEYEEAENIYKTLEEHRNNHDKRPHFCICALALAGLHCYIDKLEEELETYKRKFEELRIDIQ